MNQKIEIFTDELSTKQAAAVGGRPAVGKIRRQTIYRKKETRVDGSNRGEDSRGPAMSGDGRCSSRRRRAEGCERGCGFRARGITAIYIKPNRSVRIYMSICWTGSSNLRFTNQLPIKFNLMKSGVTTVENLFNRRKNG